jgi:hypothetical protein
VGLGVTFGVSVTTTAAAHQRCVVVTLEKTMFTRNLHDGIQSLYRFQNGYGASVVRHSGSYGGKEGLYKLAVIRFTSDCIEDYVLTYNTPITDDVIGHLTKDDVDTLLEQIRDLEQP